MIELPLKYKDKNYKVLIDKDTFNCLSKYKYNLKLRKGKYVDYVYMNIKIDNHWINGISLHRWILKDIPKGMVVDHINRNTLDNRKSNLRIITQRDNTHNRKDNKDIIGVYYFDKWSLEKPFKAMIYHHNKNISLGYYKTKQEAIKARQDAEQKIATGGVLL